MLNFPRRKQRLSASLRSRSAKMRVVLDRAIDLLDAEERGGRALHHAQARTANAIESTASVLGRSMMMIASSLPNEK